MFEIIFFVESYYHKIKGFYVIFKVLMMKSSKTPDFRNLFE